MLIWIFIITDTLFVTKSDNLGEITRHIFLFQHVVKHILFSQSMKAEVILAYLQSFVISKKCFQKDTDNDPYSNSIALEFTYQSKPNKISTSYFYSLL